MSDTTQTTPQHNVVFHTPHRNADLQDLGVNVTEVDNRPVKLDNDFVYFRRRYQADDLGDHMVVHCVEFPDDLKDGTGARAARYHYQTEILPLISQQDWVSNLLSGPFGANTTKIEPITLFFAAHEGELDLNSTSLEPFSHLLDMLNAQKRVFEDQCFWTGLIRLVITDRSILFVHKVTPRVV